MLTFAQAAVAESQQMGVLLLGVDKVAYLTDRCAIYETLYIRDSRPDQAMRNLEAALLALYAVILRFLADAIKLLDENMGTRAIHAFLNPGEVADFINKCQTREERVDIEAGICELAYSHTRHAETQDQIQKLKQLLQELREPIARVDYRIAHLWDRSNQSVHIDVLRWVSEIAYEEVHGAAIEGRTEGTGEWLLKHDRYREWRSFCASMILWLYGIRKSYLHQLASGCH